MTYRCRLLCDTMGKASGKSITLKEDKNMKLKLDGFGLLVKDMGVMIRFYRDVLGFEIKEGEDTANVYLEKDGTLFLMYGRKDFENMTGQSFGYASGECGHFEIGPGGWKIMMPLTGPLRR